ncbi:DUF2065 family protein [Hyphomonas sp.]|uniref:DUF2065 family protein n=1 Tax=Hyphomonas sp. TaxID=87 RepID=UPI00391BA414
MSGWTILLAGAGLWLLVEGALVALAPDTVRRITRLISETPPRELILFGLGAAALGALLLTIAVNAA